MPFNTIPAQGARLNWFGPVDPTDVTIGQSVVVAYDAGGPGAVVAIFMFWSNAVS